MRCLFDFDHHHRHSLQHQREQESVVKKKGIVRREPLKPSRINQLRRRGLRGGPSTAACKICGDVFPVALVWWQHDNHNFCFDCLRNYVMQRFQESDFGIGLSIKCPEAECKQRISPEDLKGIISVDVYQRWVICRINADALLLDNFDNKLYYNYNYNYKKQQGLWMFKPPLQLYNYGRTQQTPHHPLNLG